MKIPTGHQSAHCDDFVHRHLPASEDWPRFDFSDVPAPVPYSSQLNCADYLLRSAIAAGYGERAALYYEQSCWSYEELDKKARQIARYLVTETGLKPGNRVLLRSWNNPMLAACWLGVCGDVPDKL